ncbi:hypothetical protein ACLOJK_010510 [Asimina triloba]
MTEKEEQKSTDSKIRGNGNDENRNDEEAEAIELLLFQVAECYVYLVDTPKEKCCFLQLILAVVWGRADEWNVNKWAWDGALKVISKGEECIIKLEDKTTGELYARAFLRDGEPHPVEPVIDSSRYFVLRVEENIDGRLRHAFIGIGFRERTQAYDFQAALHDHMKYPSAFSFVPHICLFALRNCTCGNVCVPEPRQEVFFGLIRLILAVDVSIETFLAGETNIWRGSGSLKSAFFEQGLNNLSLEEKESIKQPKICLKLPPPSPGPLSPSNVAQPSPWNSPPDFSLQGTAVSDNALHATKESQSTQHSSQGNQNSEDAVDDDFGDFQAAG